MLGLRGRELPNAVPNSTGDPIFMTEPVFDFLANEVSFEHFEAEICTLLMISKEDFAREVELFKESINKAPKIFQVPDDGGNLFFRKMNYGLYLVNSHRSNVLQTHIENLYELSDNVVNYISIHIGETLLFGTIYNPYDAATAKQTLRSKSAQDLYSEILKERNAVLTGNRATTGNSGTLCEEL